MSLSNILNLWQILFLSIDLIKLGNLPINYTHRQTLHRYTTLRQIRVQTSYNPIVTYSLYTIYLTNVLRNI